MLRFPDEVKKKIDLYIKTLNENNVPIKEAILFGSYARGDYHQWSDIDIALVSDIFVGDRMDDKDKIRRVTLSVGSEIEVLPFSPRDFNLKNPLVREIIQTGIRLV
ncbi:Nucleotidyltransferase [Candidatus Desulfarcum epimagneticum]|uniref:Nucleotidyltransferase n=1 Tax=uncultured Desulfobacteraceae bacterium TaxID=218296 RepID=A0A484HGT0_9BACT|nr:Nucleotidyltransferase [uncultured Desulfobacteraceae bacterium]